VAVPRYAATVRSDFANAELVTVTAEPASPSTAVRDHVRPTMPVAVISCTVAQPDGPVKAGVSVFAVKNSSRASPGCTVVGIVTRWLVRLPFVEAASTNVTASAAEVGLAVCVVAPVAPASSVTVRVTVCGPGPA
jgi:hypothetical protein